jgi:hypothetical protein
VPAISSEKEGPKVLAEVVLLIRFQPLMCSSVEGHACDVTKGRYSGGTLQFMYKLSDELVNLWGAFLGAG